MPRFLLERTDDGHLDEAAASRLAATQFPEIAVEHRFELHGTEGRRELWVCRAPSEDHIHRWAEAVQLMVTRLDRIHGDVPPAASSAAPP